MELNPVAVGKCSIGNCEKKLVARGLCSMHYSRWKRHGDPEIQSKWRKLTFEDRTKDKWEVVESGCWEWTAGKQFWGYGIITVLGKSFRAHRYVYENLVGPIPEGAELDHLCRNPPCVNPAHLEPVTHKENMRRAAPHWDRPRPSLEASHCVNGHRLSEENIYRLPNGGVRCRECGRAACRRWYARKNKKVKPNE